MISGFLKILRVGWSSWAWCHSYPITTLRCMWIIHSNFNDSLLLRECLSSHTFKVSVKFPGTLVYQSIRESCHSWHPRNLPLICMVISNIQACYRPHYVTLFQWFIPVILPGWFRPGQIMQWWYHLWSPETRISLLPCWWLDVLEENFSKSKFQRLYGPLTPMRSGGWNL